MNAAFVVSSDGLFLYHQRLVAHKWLRHGFSLRRGTSGEEVSCGLNEYQPRETVLQNRQNLVRTICGADYPLAVLRQIHSDTVITAPPEVHASPPEGDGWVTSQAGILLSVQSADCLPVLLVDSQQRVVAAVHAGWRGTVQRIGQKAVRLMQTAFSCKPSDCVAVVGPAIRGCCYEVGSEVVEAFRRAFSDASCFIAKTPAGKASRPGTKMLDLAEACRRQLVEIGLAPENVHADGPCTSCDTSRFFSHRAEAGRTGRMIAVIGITKPSESHGSE